MTINDMSYGVNRIDVAVTKLDGRESAKGKKYTVATVSDGTTTEEVKVWKSLEEMTIDPPVVINASIEKQDYNGSISYVMKDWDVTGRDYRDFLPHAPIDPSSAFASILGMVNTISDPDLRLVTASLLTDNEEEFKTHPAANKIHHNYFGGLLYHTYRMVQSAVALQKVYPGLNRDLMIAGTALHDIGKLREMSVDESGAGKHTVDGNLFGHLLIGIQMVDETMRKYGVAETENTRMLKHMIASHHGKLEYGAIALPATKEALVLNEIDLIDSRIWQYEKTEAGLEAGGISEKIYGLDGVRVYKPIQTGE